MSVKIFYRSFLFVSGILVFTLLLIFNGLNTGYSKAILKPGDIVFAEWKPNSWYHGKIKEPCEVGWFINFDDGDVKCCAPHQVVKDEVPSPSELRKGVAVLAEWTTGKYYPGVISADSPPQYSIQFDDGDKKTVSITQIRLK